MRKVVALILIAVIMLLGYDESIPVQSQKPTVPAKIADMVDLINDCRHEQNLSALTISTELCEIAEIRAKEASVRWSHTRPNGQKIDSLFYDIEWRFLGENLAKHHNASNNTILNTWMNSPTHRKNILNPEFELCGIAEYQCDKISYISMIFTN